MVAIKFFVLCSVIAIGSFANEEELILKKCHLKDAGCPKKMIENFIKVYSETGIPELNIGPLDPYNFNNVSLSEMRVDFSMKNGIVKGIKKCIVNDFPLYIEKGMVKLDITCDLTVEGQYKVYCENSLFNLIAGGTIHGDGNVKLNVGKLNVKVTYYFALKKQNGGIYIKGKDDKLKHKFDVRDKLSIVVDNIYIGKKESSAKLTNLFNSNWKKIVGFGGKTVMDLAMSYANAIVKKFVDHVPASDLFFDDLTPYVTD